MHVHWCSPSSTHQGERRPAPCSTSPAHCHALCRAYQGHVGLQRPGHSLEFKPRGPSSGAAHCQEREGPCSGTWYFGWVSGGGRGGVPLHPRWSGIRNADSSFPAGG